MIPPAEPPEPTAFDGQDRARETFEAAGLRRTRQRLAVYDHLLRAAPRHPSAEEVHRAVLVDVPHLSLATVYKALDALEGAGLVVKLTGGDGSARYDAKGEHHYHFRCLRSGLVKDLKVPFDADLVDRLDPGLVESLQAEGFRVTGYRLEVVGYFEGDPGSESSPR